MTEKRFVETISTGIVTDNVTGKEYLCEMRIDEDLLELLNELHEKNKELQRHLDVMRSGALTDDKRIKELYDENKRLKQFHEKVFSLLDKEIAQNEEAIEWVKEVGGDSGSIGFYNHMLKKLKKELEK